MTIRWESRTKSARPSLGLPGRQGRPRDDMRPPFSIYRTLSIGKGSSVGAMLLLLLLYAV